MKKAVVISIFLLLIFPIISAVEFEMDTEFDQGETLLAKVSGNFLDSITEENVFFYRKHVRTPVVYDVVEVDDEFYIYALLTGKEPINYSIVIEDVRYMKGIETSEEIIFKNFTITENTADFSINPGFIVTSGGFFVKVQNLQESKITVSINSDFETPSGDSITLKSGEIKNIYFEFETVNQTLKTIELSTENLIYQIPVFITETVTIPEEKEIKFKFQPSMLEVSMATNSDANRIIYLWNLGDDIENISILVSPVLEPYVTLSIEEIDDLEKNSSERIELFLLSDTEELIVEGEIIAQTENTFVSSTLILEFIKDFIPLEEDVIGEDEIRSTLTCAEEEGAVCTENETCINDPLNYTFYARDGVCCFGTCEQVQESSTGKIIGWFMVFIIVVIILWFFKKRYMGVRNKIDLFKIARGKR